MNEGRLSKAYQRLGATVPEVLNGRWSHRRETDGAVIGQFWQKQFFKINEYGDARFYIGDETLHRDNRWGAKLWKEHLALAWHNDRKILIIEVIELPDGKVFNPVLHNAMRMLAFNEETGAFLVKEEKL